MDAYKERKGRYRKSFFVQLSLTVVPRLALALFTTGSPEQRKHAENSVSHIETQPESGSLLSEQKLCFPSSSLPAGAKHLEERD